MAKRQNFFGEWIGTLGSAIAVASATEGGRRPRSADLRRLGIDPDQFNRVRR